MNKNFIHRNSCRSCGRSSFTKILSLGEMPPANAYRRKEDLDKPEGKHPLVVYFCNNCKLLSLLDVVSPHLLYQNYHYLTSASYPLVKHFTAMANELLKKFIKSKNDLVLEIGGNDGTLLAAIKDSCRVLNVEPAENVAERSRQNGVPTISDSFSFDDRFASSILTNYGPPKIIIANNVIGHIDNLQKIFEGVKILIGDRGLFVFEVHWVGNLIGEGGFDQIYHEHLSYFSLTALTNLASQCGLKIFDAQLVPIHGQCLRVYVAKKFPISNSVGNLLEEEKKIGLDRVETFLQFKRRVEGNKKNLRKLLLNLRKQGKRIVGYGAPAKGNTLLNYFGIDGSILDFITDTTPFKQGTYTPGTRIPIYSPEKLYKINPDYVLLLAWNYADAILEKEEALRQKGVKFIIPVPEPKII